MDFNVQLKVSLSEKLSKRLSQKVKSPSVFNVSKLKPASVLGLTVQIKCTKPLTYGDRMSLIVPNLVDGHV